MNTQHTHLQYVLLDTLHRWLWLVGMCTSRVGWLDLCVSPPMRVTGSVGGKPCSDQSKLSGMAYLCGTDTWVDLPRLLRLSFTQPDKVGGQGSTLQRSVGGLG